MEDLLVSDFEMYLYVNVWNFNIIISYNRTLKTVVDVCHVTHYHWNFALLTLAPNLYKTLITWSINLNFCVMDSRSSIKMKSPVIPLKKKSRKYYV